MLATRIGEELRLGDAELSDVYYMTLLRFVGCTAPSHEYTQAFGGDHVVGHGRGDMSDMASPREAMAFLASFSEGLPAWRRPAALLSSLTRAPKVGEEGLRSDCEVAVRLARRFQLSDGVALALDQSFERWDGRGAPQRISGGAVALPSRVAAVAFTAAMFHAAAGRPAAVEAVGRWRGGKLDPALADVFLSRADDLLQELETGDVWLTALAAEPSPQRHVRGGAIDEVARGCADFVDLKSPYLLGHSTGVAALAEVAGRAAGLADADAVDLRRAALLHDLGRAGVSTVIWEKPGPLSSGEWEEVRLHAYHSERILARSQALAPLAQLAGMHHERLDGSGYHRGAPAAMQTKAARILAAADVYQALTSERPHRPALDRDAAARVLESQPGLDPEAVAAVLEAGGARGRRQPHSRPADLTEREVEVLRLLAKGRSEKQIAAELFISTSTVHTHVNHIYEKAHVSTRASAALFAMEHGLL